MSAQSEIGKLAFIIGKEVADNVGKKAAPIVAKAVPKVKEAVEGWGFKPKPGEISGTAYFNAKKMKNPDKEIIKKFDDQLQSAFDREKFNGWLPESRYPALFKSLESQGVPRKYTGKIVKHIDDAGYYENNYKVANKITNHLKKMTPPERDLFMNMADEYGGTYGYDEYAREAKDLMKGLTRSQQETFASLYPEWSGTMKELIQAAKNL